MLRCRGEPLSHHQNPPQRQYWMLKITEESMGAYSGMSKSESRESCVSFSRSFLIRQTFTSFTSAQSCQETLTQCECLHLWNLLNRWLRSIEVAHITLSTLSIRLCNVSRCSCLKCHGRSLAARCSFAVCCGRLISSLSLSPPPISSYITHHGEHGPGRRRRASRPRRPHSRCRTQATWRQLFCHGNHPAP